MNAKNDLNRKSRNSFIYFQVGLVATMLVALLFLEFSIKDVTKPSKGFTGTLYVPEPTFVYTPPVANPVTEKQIVKKVVVPKDITKIKLVEDKVIVEKEKFTTQDDKTDPKDTKTDNESENKVNDNNDAKNTGVVDNSPRNSFAVEVLPMFPACQGLSKAAQKVCFEEQLYKEVNKNISYPQDDLYDNKEGTAFIAFIIDEKGNIVNVEAIDNKRATKEMMKAAEKAVKKLPKLIPAKQGEQSVKMKYLLPVHFKIAK